jgi:hypothetical protein
LYDALLWQRRPSGPPPASGSRLRRKIWRALPRGLVGQAVLYRWPVEGWVRGTVTGRSRAAGFSHVVRSLRCGRTSALGAGVVASLLDAASPGPAGRWVLLRRAVP